MAALLGALALLASGCGASSSGRSPSGATVFAGSCRSCHSLSRPSSPRQQGGDLRRVHLSRSVLTQFTAEMPVRHRLTATELRAVVDYVLAVQRGQ
jgi:mono/diheme cytochrome c family protein